MARKKLVALLRGINVGGKNPIPMAKLRSCLEDAGLTGVTTYIQSGNAPFDDPGGPRDALRRRLEKAVAARFGCEVPILLVSGDELAAVVADAPAGFGRKPDEHRYDALFVLPPLTAKEALAQMTLADGVDRAWAGDGVVYFSRLIRLASKSRLSRLTGTPLYARMTIRNWNTTTKLAELAGARP